MSCCKNFEWIYKNFDDKEKKVFLIFVWHHILQINTTSYISTGKKVHEIFCSLTYKKFWSMNNTID